MMLSRDFGRPRLPSVLAAEIAECGLACLAMIAGYHGRDVDLNGLRQRFGVPSSGLSLAGLMDIANRVGFSTRALRVELDKLRQVPVPAVLHWDMCHFVVLKAVGRTHVTIHDPAVGHRVLTHAEVSKHFTGVVLECTPSTAFEPVRAAMPVRIAHLWSSLRGAGFCLAQVLALSAVLQIGVFVAPLQLQLVIDNALPQGDHDLLFVVALGFAMLTILQAATEALRNWVVRVLGHLLSFQIEGNLVRHLLRLPVDYFEKRSVGDIVSRLASAQPIRTAITEGLAVAIIDGAMAVIAVYLLFFYSPLLAVVVLSSLVLNILVSLAFLPRQKARGEEAIVAEAREQTHLIETVRAMTTLKLLAHEGVREAAWRNLHADATNANVSIGRLQISQAFLQSTIGGLQTVLVVYLAGRMILDAQGFSVGMLFAFLAYRQLFTERSLTLLNQLISFRLLRLHLDRLADIITTPADLPAPSPALSDFRGSIRLRQVGFRYGSTGPAVLDGIDLTVAPGDYIAIHGASGGGKTTLLKLILGLYAPTEGHIELDGHRASPALWQGWRRKIATVSQDDHLLSGTIADNIAGFASRIDMQRVVDVARRVHVHDDVARLPMQYLTLVGDMGSALSGGQRQRLLLARALYREPAILVLDEGTANLDETNEELIADLLETMEITRIVVAHRPALLRRADRTLRLENGRLEASARAAPAASSLAWKRLADIASEPPDVR